MLVGSGVLRQAGVLLRSFLAPAAVAVIADARVAELHLGALSPALRSAGFDVGVCEVPPGEASKSLESAGRVYEWLAAQGHARDSLMVALGGGVTGDLAGFVAATWMRGIPWVNCPTTIEAAVDAAVGGKTGVNLASGKNLVGTFHPPRLVLIDVDTFATLPERDFVAGMAEAVKHGVVRDGTLLDWLESNAGTLRSGDAKVLVELVCRNVRIKADVVAEDERETGGRDGIGRAALNYGHTLGHALESYFGYELRHGECVGLGMLAAASIAAGRGVAAEDLRARLCRVLGLLGLPVATPREVSCENVAPFLARDKKSSGGRTRFVLASEPGRLFWADDVRTDEIESALAQLRP